MGLAGCCLAGKKGKEGERENLGGSNLGTLEPEPCPTQPLCRFGIGDTDLGVDSFSYNRNILFTRNIYSSIKLSELRHRQEKKFVTTNGYK